MVLDERGVHAATGAARALGLAPALVVLQQVTEPFVLHIACTVVIVRVSLVQRWRARALWAFLTIMVGWGLGAIVKQLVHRPRPVVVDPLWQAKDYSFPSGHAQNVALAAVSTIILLWPLMSKTGRRLAVVLAGVLALVVGLDRVLLGVHFPSDVLAGWIMGAGLATTSWRLFGRSRSAARPA
jgi:membrane-associated phospholipid phosphatase